MEPLLYALLGILLLVVITKIFAWPVKILIKLVVNGVLGVVLLLIVNYIGAYWNFSIGINVVTALIAGFAGIPGVIFLILFKLFL